MAQVRTVRKGNWTDYDDTTRLALRRGARLTAEDISLHLAQHAREELAVRRDIGSPATAVLPLQVGVPCYLDMAMIPFGPAGFLRHGRQFLHATAGQIADIHTEAGDSVVFQLELPAALIAVATMPRAFQPAMAWLMARIITRQVDHAPEGTRFGVHLCLGDLAHKAIRQLRTTDPLVWFTNAIVRQWPRGRRLEYVHLPLSGGELPPPTDSTFYQPLRGLRLDARVVAGIAHENQNRADQLAVRTYVEQALGTTVDIATSCGLGRRTPEQAEQVVAAMRALLH
jgi:hypothetical protein